MAIATGTVTTDSKTDGTTLTFAHDAGSGDNRILVLCISVNDKDADQLTTVTYDGTAMIQAEQKSHASESVETWIYYLANPSENSNNVVVTTSTHGMDVMASAINLTGANESDPLDTVSTNTGTDDHPNVSITTQDNNTMIIACHSVDYYIADSIPDDTEVEEADSHVGAVQHIVHSFYKTSAGAENLGGSSYDNGWASVAASFNEAPSGTNTQINIGDAWKANAAMKINIGDAWKDVAGIQINIGDAWKTVM